MRSQDAVFWVVLAVIFALVTAIVGGRKQENYLAGALLWFVIGLLLGPLGLIWALFSKEE